MIVARKEKQAGLRSISCSMKSKVLTSRLLCLSEIKGLAPPIEQQIFELLFFLKQLIIVYW